MFRTLSTPTRCLVLPKNLSRPLTTPDALSLGLPPSAWSYMWSLASYLTCSMLACSIALF